MDKGREKTAVPALIGDPRFLLAVVAIMNATLYLLLFVYPQNLLSLYRQPLLDLRHMSSAEPLARWWLLASFVLLGLLYWLGWSAARLTRGRAAWLLVLGSAAFSGTILLFLYPFDAADIFDYIMSGRIQGLYGGNPFVQVAAGFADDPFYHYVAWRDFPSAYGPVWELVAAAAARLAGDGIVANVLAFKLVGGLFLAGCIGIVAALLRRTAPEQALAGTLLLAWNPLILYETLGQGHNDVAMLFCILLATWWLAGRHFTLAILALLLGALVKFIPVLLLPAAGLVALRSLPGTGRRLRFVAVTAGAAALLVMLTYAPFWQGIETLGIERRQALLTASLPAAIYGLLIAPLGNERAISVVSLLAAAITAIFALWQGLRAARTPSWLAFVQAAFAILMFYLLCTCLWFQQWYAIWPLGLVPLLPAGPLAWLGITFGFAVLAKPLIVEPIWLWPCTTVDRGWLEPRLGPSVMALPWLLALIALWRSRRKGRL